MYNGYRKVVQEVLGSMEYLRNLVLNPPPILKHEPQGENVYVANPESLDVGSANEHHHSALGKAYADLRGKCEGVEVTTYI